VDGIKDLLKLGTKEEGEEEELNGGELGREIASHSEFYVTAPNEM
jgi:hypothetical protein